MSGERIKDAAAVAAVIVGAILFAYGIARIVVSS